MSDFDKSLELLKAELEKSETGMSADEIKDLLAKGTSDEEKAQTVLELLEKAKKKAEEEEETEEEEEEEETEEEENGDDDIEKSLYSEEGEDYENYVSADPVLRVIMKSLSSLSKKVGKQESLIKSMGKALIGVAELTKSTHEAVDVVASLPAPLKGQILSLTKSQKEELAKGAVDRFPAQEQELTRESLIKSIDKAYDDGNISLAQFSFLTSQISANRPIPQEYHSLIKSYIEGGK